MLRVGLTGGLGSGKSTVAGILRELGAHVIEADELGRRLMEPGQDVYQKIVAVFGPEAVLADGRLNRPWLARAAFEQGRLQELNAIVHPAVIDAQHGWMREVLAQDPAAVAVVESALIFEVERDARARGESEGVLSDWRKRFDRVLVLTAPDEIKIERYSARVAAGAANPEEALRVGQQMRGKGWRSRCPTRRRLPAPTLSSRIPVTWMRCGARSSAYGSNCVWRATNRKAVVH